MCLCIPERGSGQSHQGSHPPLIVNGCLGCPACLHFAFCHPSLQMGLSLLLVPERTERRCLCLPDSSTYRNASCLHFWQPLVDLDGGQQLATQPLWVSNQKFSKCTCAVRAHANPAWPLCTTIASSPCKPPMSSVALVWFSGKTSVRTSYTKMTG